MIVARPGDCRFFNGPSLHIHNRECDLRYERLVARINFGCFRARSRNRRRRRQNGEYRIAEGSFRLHALLEAQWGRGSDATAEIITLSYEQFTSTTGPVP